MITDYIKNTMWRLTPDEQSVTVIMGDLRRIEAPLGKIQRLITAAFESISVLTLSPQSG
jgi:hypothetical protein